MKPTASDVLVDLLVKSGVREVYGVVGDALNSFNDAIRRDGNLRWVGVRHEEAGAFAAGAQAQLGAPFGVCCGTVGPGAIHLLNGLYDAKASYAPVLAITGQVPTDEIGTEFHQEVNLHRLFSDVAVYHQTVTHPDRMERLARIAIREAIAKRGVAVLSIPGDVGAQSVSQAPSDQGVPVHQPTMVPAASEVDALVELVDSSERVTLLVGAGAAGAQPAISALADRLKAPVVASLRGKEIMERDEAHYLGQTGLIGNPAAHQAIMGSDLLLMLGTDLPYRDWLPQEGHAVAQIDMDASHLGRRCPLTLGVVGHVSPTVSVLVDRVEARDDEGFLAEHRETYRRWHQGQQAVGAGDESLARGVVQTLSNPAGRIRPEQVAYQLDRQADADAIFAADVGMSTVWAARFLHLGGDRRLLTSFNLASMANALPQAIGAQLRHPDRQVITLSGDGGFTMLMGELLTAVQEELPVKIVIFNNESYGMVRLEQTVAGMPPTETGLKNPDFGAVATAMGATGIRVEKPEEVEGAVRRLLETPGPAVLDALTNPDALSMPPAFEPDQAWGFATSKLKSVLQAARERVE